ncbi:LTV-domain-containing protein [Panus rudis PR-1116 ss-1]|nr:LTV-domain-containing protein [Panus rudis PR-1116 ss-1]
MPPKSIFRQPGAKHFQLVHRSQRDPLIHDPEASKHVLKEVERGNAKKGKSRADLESLISAKELAGRENIGEAAAYGIYYDDTEYDYMQHLRPVGVQEDGVDSILIEAPTKSKSKGKSKAPIDLIELPEEALPSKTEVPRNYESQEAIPSSIAGFQPDMDPHLRQVLEALEDDAFVDDDLEDDFFGELVAEGERALDEEFDFEFREEGVESEERDGADAEEEDEEEGWEARFAKFKKAQKAAAPPSDGSDLDLYSEGGDTIGALPQMSVIGGKKRRKGTSDASGYSMSSSSMFRNEGLTTLDERFEQIQKEYESDEEEGAEGSDTDSAPELITSRDDFDAMMNEFLDNYEIIGGKMKPTLEGDTATEKLDTIRKALGEVKIREQGDDESDENDDILMPLDVDDKKDRWDCETILTTYSNLENHPRLIRARHERPVPKIRLDPKTGLPYVEDESPRRSQKSKANAEEEEEDLESHPARVTVARPKNESKEEKKMRKQAVKAERQARRVEKKITKEQFTAEAKKQVKTISQKESNQLRKL